jgi:3-oxoacyl-[acyl-carrier protein] reductase
MGTLLAEKVALVTGGSRGIGAAIARRLGADGADVAISYVNSTDQAEAVVAEIQALGVRAVAIRADQGQPEEGARLVQAVVDHFGRLDILVNNAAVRVTGSIDDPNRDEAAVRRLFDVNLHGVASVVRAAAPHLGEGGRIISIGSGGTFRTAFPGAGDYAASKAAMATYTRSWARDLGPKGVTANIVQVGPIATDMNPETGPFADAQRANMALKRFGQPEEIAAVVSFLAGPDASFVSGATLAADGGFNA